MSRTTVGLAIVTKDRYLDTVETLLQIDHSAFDKVVVVDDSEDGELANWCARTTDVTYIRGPGVNMQAARNRAIKELSTDVVTFIDDDVYCAMEFADLIRERFDQRDDLVALGGPCLPVVGENRSDICTNSTLEISATGTIYGDASDLVPEEAIEVDTLRGANMSFRRTALNRVGGFDEKYGGHSQREETDLLVRISELGGIIYDPDIKCYHKEKGADFSEELFVWRFRNHGRFVRKNFGLLAGIGGFFGLFLRLCGSPESIYQLAFEKYVLRRPISISGCLIGYLKGLVSN